jgi:hypothetical protein
LPFVLTLVFALIALVVILQVRATRRLKTLLAVGLVLRVVGGLGYLYIINAYYGRGDFTTYYERGLEIADAMGHGDYSPLLDSYDWVGGRWWGTQFCISLTGVILGLFGPTLAGAFVIYALIGYVGIVAFGLAFQRAFPAVPVERYFVWIALFPSLWFWPAALGKDAVVLCGVGLATLGFVGRRGQFGWLSLASGVLLVFCVRPQVAATLVFALAAGFWLGTSGRWSPGRILQGVLILIGGGGVIVLSSGALGVELHDVEEVENYLDRRSEVSARGGSSLEGSSAPWLAPINTLFRPFPWEAQGIMALLGSAEVASLWILAWLRRKRIRAFVRAYRGSRLFWTALVFVAVYSTALGMSIGNMGIIARQRVHILPFLLMFIAGGPKRQKTAAAPRLEYASALQNGQIRRNASRFKTNASNTYDLRSR